LLPNNFPTGNGRIQILLVIEVQVGLGKHVDGSRSSMTPMNERIRIRPSDSGLDLVQRGREIARRLLNRQVIIDSLSNKLFVLRMISTKFGEREKDL
jgi:hypothetical protein